MCGAKQLNSTAVLPTPRQAYTNRTPLAYRTRNIDRNRMPVQPEPGTVNCLGGNPELIYLD